MEKLFTGDLVSYFTQLDVVNEIWKGLPRTLWLAFGAMVLWMVFSDRVRALQRGARRQDQRQGC